MVCGLGFGVVVGVGSRVVFFLTKRFGFPAWVWFGLRGAGVVVGVDVCWFSLFRAFLMLHPLIFGLHPPILLVLFLGLSCGLGWVGFWA